MYRESGAKIYSDKVRRYAMNTHAKKEMIYDLSAFDFRINEVSPFLLFTDVLFSKVIRQKGIDYCSVRKVSPIPLHDIEKERGGDDPAIGIET